MSSEEFHLSQGKPSNERVFVADTTGAEVELHDAPYSKEVAMQDIVHDEQLLADRQPRRVRTNEQGQTEKLVKYSDGSFDWELLESSAENSGVETAAIEAVVVGLDAVELANERMMRDNERMGEEIAQLQDQLSAVLREVEELRQMNAGRSVESEEDIVDAELVEGEEGSVDAEETPVGKELELYEGEEGEIVFSHEIPEELAQELERSAGDYAHLTAKARKGYLGQLLQNSKYLVKVPLFKRAADKLNEWSDKKLDASREEYQRSLESVQQEIQAQYEAQYEESERDEAYESDLRNAKQFALMQSHADLQEVITAEREAQSGKSSWLSRKFTNGSPMKGKLAIAGTAAAIGVGIGMLGGGKWGGAAAGAGVGAAMGHHVNRRRANVENEAGETLAAQHAAEDIKSLRSVFAEKYDSDGDDASIEDLINSVQQRTADERQGNRSRLKTAMGIGAAAGGLSAGVTEMLSGTVGAETITAEPEPQPDPVVEEVAPEPVPVAEVLQADPTIGNYDYPWNWASDTFGVENATNTLKQLGELAAQDGHTIQWNGDGVNEWVQVDGMSDTQSVLDILSRYTGRL